MSDRSQLASAVYTGSVRHRRFRPVRHAFTYGLFMMYLDLDELPGLFDRRWLWSVRHPAPARFRRRDHLGDPERDLASEVRRLVGAAVGRAPVGPIRLLTHLRYFGYGFNPVSLYYLFDGADERVEAIVAEVNNTPWGERHCYVLPGEVSPSRVGRYRFDKEFHVSPFMPMDLEYDWRVSMPGERLAVHIENRRGEEPLFDATLLLERREIGTASLASCLLRFPFMTARVVSAIHWQAARLWWKKAPFHPHPGRLGARSEAP